MIDDEYFDKMAERDAQQKFFETYIQPLEGMFSWWAQKVAKDLCERIHAQGGTEKKFDASMYPIYKDVLERCGADIEALHRKAFGL